MEENNGQGDFGQKNQNRPQFAAKERVYRRNTPSQQPIFPVTKVTLRKRPTPDGDPNIIRLRFLERPYRWYHALSFHWQAFIKTVILSFILVVPSYHFVYMVARTHMRAEVMGKMDPYFTSD